LARGVWHIPVLAALSRAGMLTGIHLEQPNADLARH
jgi:hypothetical protein